MRGARVNVQLRGNARPFQGKIHEHAILGRTDEIFASIHEKDRRCSGRDMNARRKFFLILGLQMARIDRNGEIRPATDFVDLIYVVLFVLSVPRGASNTRLSS
jgi:hypothetical protein